MRITVAASLLALALTAACGATDTPGGNDPAAQAASTTAGSAPAKKLTLGDSATVVGEKGNKIRITPTGVYYYKGGPQNKPEKGIFVAVAYKAEALDAVEGIPAGGFAWRGAGETAHESIGQPWIGRVNVPIAGQDVQPGEHQSYIATFDVPEKGGALIYTTLDGEHARWILPKTTKGSGLKPIAAAMKVMGLKY